MLNLRQDISVLNNIVALGVEEYVTLVRAGKLDPDRIDHLLCHYSSEYFHGDIVKLMSDAGLMIPEEKWFTNLHTKGNTGAASIFIMLEEAMRTGRFKEGDRILLMVPESGRFTVSFAHLTCVGPDDAVEEKVDSNGRWLIEELALVWAEFERLLTKVPIVKQNRSPAGLHGRLPAPASQPPPAGHGGIPVDHTEQPRASRSNTPRSAPNSSTTLPKSNVISR